MLRLRSLGRQLEPKGSRDSKAEYMACAWKRRPHIQSPCPLPGRERQRDQLRLIEGYEREPKDGIRGLHSFWRVREKRLLQVVLRRNRTIQALLKSVVDVCFL